MCLLKFMSVAVLNFRGFFANFGQSGLILWSNLSDRRGFLGELSLLMIIIF